MLVAIESFIISSLAQLAALTGNLGLAIIAFTLLIRAVLIPLTLPSLRAQKQMREVKPELDKLKKKHKNDKQKLQQAQMELYKRYNINPLAGCLPQLVQLGMLIVLYRALLHFLGNPVVNGVSIDTTFLWMNLGQPDQWRVLPVVAALSQLVLSIMIIPGGEQPDVVPNKSKKKKVQKENEKEEDFAEMAASMQKQMMFMMPLMTGFIALSFPSGLVLYWVVTTLFSLGQQWVISGPGGLVLYPQRIQNWYQKNIQR